MNLKNITFSLALLMPGALSAMDEAKASASLKKAAVSIIFKTSNSETPITKDLTISYPERGKIVSSSEPLTQTFSSGAYTAHVEIKEQTDVKLGGSKYTADWGLYDCLQVSSEILHNGELGASSNGDIPVNGKEGSFGKTANYPVSGPATFAKLVIIAKALNNK
jgi:hypothetical protein